MKTKAERDNGIRLVERFSANLIGTKWIDLKVKSYAGYASSGRDHMFCWFFESQTCMPGDDPGKFPLLIWLNGGPGGSSLLGLLLENGPYLMRNTDTGSIVENPYSWNKEAHIMYWDNPVGSGYSYNDGAFKDGKRLKNGKPGSYVEDEKDLGMRFYKALQVFYHEHPEYRRCPLYITGESYGGKYIPAIANTIMKMNDRRKKSKSCKKRWQHIKLKGLAIGNPWMTAVLQTRLRLECGFELGFLDTKQYKTLMRQYRCLPGLIDYGEWQDAFDLNQQIKDELIACGGGVAIYDVRIWDNEFPNPPFDGYFNLPAVRKALHVRGGAPWVTADETGPVTQHLIKDFVSSSFARGSGDSIIPLLEHRKRDGKTPSYRLLLYTGDLDMSCGFRGTEEILYNLKWSHRREWRALDRRVWAEPPGTFPPEKRHGGKTLGFIKSYANLTQVAIPCSGHMVPISQPETSLRMVNNFIFKRPFPSYDPLRSGR